MGFGSTEKKNDEGYQKMAYEQNAERNAQAVFLTVEAQNMKIDELETANAQAQERITQLERDLINLTARFNMFFVESLGHGATADGDNN